MHINEVASASSAAASCFYKRHLVRPWRTADNQRKWLRSPGRPGSTSERLRRRQRLPDGDSPCCTRGVHPWQLVIHGVIFFATTAATALQFAREVAGKLPGKLQRVTCPICNLSRNSFGRSTIAQSRARSYFLQQFTWIVLTPLQVAARDCNV